MSIRPALFTGAVLAVAAAARCRPAPVPADAAIPLFDGTGTSPGDVRAVAAVLDAGGWRYAIVGLVLLSGPFRSLY